MDHSMIVADFREWDRPREAPLYVCPAKPPKMALKYASNTQGCHLSRDGSFFRKNWSPCIHNFGRGALHRQDCPQLRLKYGEMAIFEV